MGSCIEKKLAVSLFITLSSTSFMPVTKLLDFVDFLLMMLKHFLHAGYLLLQVLIALLKFVRDQLASLA